MAAPSLPPSDQPPTDPPPVEIGRTRTHSIITPDDADFHESITAGDKTVIEFRVGTIRELDRMARDLEKMTREIVDLSELLRKARAPFYLLRQTDITVIEIFLSLSSIWAFLILVFSPFHFSGQESNYRNILGLSGRENFWAAFAFIAALMKLFGLSLVYLRKKKDSSLIPRYIGLSMSGVFWCLMGASTIVGNPDTLFGFTGFLMGIVAWWSVLRLTR